MGSDPKSCPFCGAAASRSAPSYGTPVARCGDVHCVLGPSDWILIDDWNERPIEDALRARAEAAEQRAEAAEREVERLRAAIDEAVAELPVWPEGAYQTPAERDVSWVRGALLAALAEARPAGEVADGCRPEDGQ